jgi:acyl-coenzyme A synthetase/AMP-(fatty) acid ligase
LPAGIEAAALEELGRRYKPEHVGGMDRGAAEVWGIPPSARSWAVETWEDCSFTSDTGETSAVEASTRGGQTPSTFLAPLAATSQTQTQTETRDGTALLLSTSGSTGSPKMVRLGLSAVRANARAIARALGITREEIAPSSLPIHYSYGLSVVNSHLVAGATVMLTDESLMSDGFWAACRAHQVTSLAGVPYSYQLLRRLDLAKLAPPELKTFTQAGGRMEPAMVLHFHKVVSARGGRLFVMYGQTEATARIAILAAEDLPECVGSVGRAIDGEIEIAEDGEVVYRGSNVMLGYAESRAEVNRPDELEGRLFTGDLGRLDEAGRLWITGRKKRIVKVFGNRLGLDELEAFLRSLESECALAVIADGERVRVFVESPGPEAEKCATLRQRLAEHTGLHLSGFVVSAITAIPRLLGGKIDYQRLEAEKAS